MVSRKSNNEGAKDFKVMEFSTPENWRKFLAKNHSSSNGIWLKFHKKISEVKSITYPQALDEALCYGWIDGQAKSFDGTAWMQKFTPRRTKSIWSKRNTEKVMKLIQEKRMQPSGMKEVEAAKADGRWQKAYDSPSNMVFPEDFMKLLGKNRKALKFFESLNKTNKYAIAWRLQTAKKAETKQKRMKAILEMLSKEEKFH